MNYFTLPGIPRKIIKDAKKIISAVEQVLGITYLQMSGRNREQSIVDARHVCIFLIRRSTKMSLVEIGKLFNRDHTSIIHACRNIQNHLDTGDYTHEYVMLVDKVLTGGALIGSTRNT